MKRPTLSAMLLAAALPAFTGFAQEGDRVVRQVSAAGSAADGLFVGDAKQLFIDDLFFDTRQGIALRVHPARKTGERNLQRDRPWESATPNWFSVLQDGATCRMWYECYDVEGWPTTDDTSFCYAQSEDGVHWDKPDLGLFSYQGSDSTNILFRLIGPEGAHSRVHGACVFVDPSAPAGERYKAVSQGLFSEFTPPYRVAGMVSPDGLYWTRLAAPICETPADSQYSSFWDPNLSKYVLYGRVGGRGRAIGRSESSDFAHFGPLELVMQTDDQDPPDSDLYNPAVVRYPYAANVYLAFPSLYQHRSDTLDIRLAVSRDGVHWTWPERVPFIPVGTEGEFDSGSLYMGQGLVRQGDELWQYYGGSGLKHEESELENLVKPDGARVYSRVVSRLDGFVSADAGPEGGALTTVPLSFTGGHLELNVQVRPGGEVRAGLVDGDGTALPGLAPDDCDPITGDHVARAVAWRGSPDLSALAGHAVRLQVRLRDASLYAFQFARRPQPATEAPARASDRAHRGAPGSARSCAACGSP